MNFSVMERGEEEIKNKQTLSESILDEEQDVVEVEVEVEVEEEEEDEFEFSFVSVNTDGSPIFAEEAFRNGEIRPVFPLFNRDLLFTEEDYIYTRSPPSESKTRSPLRKLFVEKEETGSTTSSSEPEGPFCEWSAGMVKSSSSPDICRKSNSTGFSKLRRLRELVLRSNSDGKDKFMFLNNDHNNNKNKSKIENQIDNKSNGSRVDKKETKKVKSGEKSSSSSSSAHERHYVRNRAEREGDKRKSYLPYRVGFFASVNGLSRNVHPF